ncbi:uncharacterized protein A4U43_C04F1450 [Asparagus officinalis]|uniref:Uncharacterized protein n=1 Tax=Asparagus officinalis TaxID=4686 RepID=A0A5P1F1W6_ASPOF|nr:uncharacterized protein A4U43_C04F1450 [Asparagus officinalis]
MEWGREAAALGEAPATEQEREAERGREAATLGEHAATEQEREAERGREAEALGERWNRSGEGVRGAWGRELTEWGRKAVFKQNYCKRKSPVLFDTETDVMRPTKFPRVDDGGQLVDVVRRYVHQFQDTNEQSTVNNNHRRGNLYSGTEVPLDPQMSRFAPFSSQLTSEQVTEMNWMQTQGINQMEVYRVDAVDGSNPFYNSHDTDNYSQQDQVQEVEDFARRLNSDWPERMQEILSLGQDKRLVPNLLNGNGSLRRYTAYAPVLLESFNILYLSHSGSRTKLAFDA